MAVMVAMVVMAAMTELAIPPVFLTCEALTLVQTPGH
jgi:hypothetical protein